MLPESLQGADGRGVINLLEKTAQALALGAAMLGIDRIVDINVEFGREEFGKARIGKVQYIAAPSDEIDEVVYEL
jgi:hypothetical protein